MNPDQIDGTEMPSGPSQGMPDQAPAVPTSGETAAQMVSETSQAPAAEAPSVAQPQPKVESLAADFVHPRTGEHIQIDDEQMRQLYARARSGDPTLIEEPGRPPMTAAQYYMHVMTGKMEALNKAFLDEHEARYNPDHGQEAAHEAKAAAPAPQPKAPYKAPINQVKESNNSSYNNFNNQVRQGREGMASAAPTSSMAAPPAAPKKVAASPTNNGITTGPVAPPAAQSGYRQALPPGPERDAQRATAEAKVNARPGVGHDPSTDPHGLLDYVPDFAKGVKDRVVGMGEMALAAGNPVAMGIQTYKTAQGIPHMVDEAKRFIESPGAYVNQISPGQAAHAGGGLAADVAVGGAIGGAGRLRNSIGPKGNWTANLEPGAVAKAEAAAEASKKAGSAFNTSRTAPREAGVTPTAEAPKTKKMGGGGGRKTSNPEAKTDAPKTETAAPKTEAPAAPTRPIAEDEGPGGGSAARPHQVVDEKPAAPTYNPDQWSTYSANQQRDFTYRAQKSNAPMGKLDELIKAGKMSEARALVEQYESRSSTPVAPSRPNSTPPPAEPSRTPAAPTSAELDAEQHRLEFNHFKTQVSKDPLISKKEWQKALRDTGNDYTKAARILGIDYTPFKHKAKAPAPPVHSGHPPSPVKVTGSGVGSEVQAAKKQPASSGMGSAFTRSTGVGSDISSAKRQR